MLNKWKSLLKRSNKIKEEVNNQDNFITDLLILDQITINLLAKELSNTEGYKGQDVIQIENRFLDLAGQEYSKLVNPNPETVKDQANDS